MISIVMAYYNRRKLLLNTLYSITKTKCKSEFEIIIIDDASRDEHSIIDIPKYIPNLDIKIKVVNINKKWWCNPCIPTNIGISMSKGDKIIIQNPECLHMNDIISYVDENLIVGDYLVFAAYAINNNKTLKVNELQYNSDYIKNIENIIYPTKNTAYIADGWYQHSIYRPRCLNFCSAIMKTDLDDLGWFDERFAKGSGKDDKEFIERIKRKKMNIKSFDDKMVIHQFHGNTKYDKYLTNKNIELYNISLKENNYKVDNSISSKLKYEVFL